MKPKLSIIIPIYNTGKYLAPALESVRAQTFEDWECICVDNASTDKSLDVAQEFAKRDERFVIIERPDNGGVSVGRNAGLVAARGEYITFFDHDDLLSPDTFDIYMDLAEKCAAEMVRGRCLIVPENFELKDIPRTVGREYFYCGNPKREFAEIAFKKRYELWMYVWTCCFKKDAIKNILFNEDLFAGGEDNLFMARVIDDIKNFAQSEDVCVYHRQSAVSTSLGGFSPFMMKKYAVSAPWLYEYFKGRKDGWAKFVQWREMVNMYRHVMQAVVENCNIGLARETIGSFYNTPAMQRRYLNIKQKILLALFMRGRIGLVKILKKVL